MRVSGAEANPHLKMAEFIWRPGDNLILVMGESGVGKSHFVRAATGDTSIEVGGRLHTGQSQQQRHSSKSLTLTSSEKGQRSSHTG